MNALNYDRLMEEQLAKLNGNRLLLHCCCAPCASACLQRLKDYFDIYVLFYNPNIEGGEYERRKQELLRFIELTGWAKPIDCGWDGEEFYGRIKGLEREKEGGKRCEECFKLRLEKTAELADEGGFDYFATTLTLSPLKNAELINQIGKGLERGKAQWLYSDFKKKDGYLNSIKLSKQYGLYRQNYCGCVYSRTNA